jgi:hypothetical protein
MSWSTISAVILVLATAAVAQNKFTAPAEPMAGPTFTVGLGYEYLAMQGFPASGVPLNGADASGAIGFNRRWAANVDLSYVRAANILGTGRSGYVLGLLAGPALYWKEYRNASLFTHVLFGSAFVDSVVPTADGYIRGWVARPSFGVGGGIERSLRGRLSVRVYGDYVRTSFANSLAVVEPENDFRSVVSLAFRLPFKSSQ